MPLITAENATILAHLSVQARKEKAERTKQLESTAIQLAQRLAERTVVEKPLQAKVEQLEIQIAQVDKLLASCRDAKEIGILSLAKERFINTWGYIVGHAKPPTSKPSRQRRTAQDIQPLPNPEPIQPTSVPAKPLGWEYDGGIALQ